MPNHECPLCGEICECLKGNEVLRRNPHLEKDELDDDDCEHECDEDLDMD